MFYSFTRLILLLLLLPAVGYCQVDPGASTLDKIAGFPASFFGRIQHKTADLDKQLTAKTDKYLQQMARREARLQKKLYRVDSTAAKNLFSNSAEQYARLAQKIKSDTGGVAKGSSGEYQPYTDSLAGSLAFLQQNPQLVASNPQLQSSFRQLQALQAKMGDADEAKAFIRQRKQQIGDYISQHASLQGLMGKSYVGMNQDLYYYSQELRQYKDMLNDPDRLEQKALSLLNQLPAFQNFMKNNGQLAGLFSLPGNYGTAAAVAGLQTRDQVNQLIEGQLASGGPNAAAALQSNLQSAQSQLGGFKDKLNQLGGGSGDIDMPAFKPNEQKTKTFFRRLEFGTNLQTTRANYYFPSTTDVGLSVGYKINNCSTAGIGASYKVGWGTGFNHIAFSSQGAGLRSFIDIKIKGSFYATGGLEYNYTNLIASLQQIRNLDTWSQSGLIGISKTISVKSRTFKKTKLQLLWDFLSYRQVPQTQPLLFRVGYNF